MEKLKIPDEAVFDTESVWYSRAKNLYEVWSTRKMDGGHRHHWIPCAVVARILMPGRHAKNYRDIADEIFPQKTVRMPVSAHTLLHYYIWKAALPKFRHVMKSGFMALYSMTPLNDQYLDTLKCLLDAEDIVIKKRPPKAPKREDYINPIAVPTVFNSVFEARQECSRAWKRYSGPLTWPKFQHRFMKGANIVKQKKAKKHHKKAHTPKDPTKAPPV